MSTAPHLTAASITSQLDIARHAMAKELYRETGESDGLPWESLSQHEKASWLEDVDRMIKAAEANSYRFERDLGTADWHEGDGQTYIIMSPAQRGEATGCMENILDSVITSVVAHVEKGKKRPDAEGYVRVIESDLHARGWAILPMGHLAFDRAAEIADEIEEQQERHNGAANTGGAAEAAAAIRAAKAKYYSPESEAQT